MTEAVKIPDSFLKKTPSVLILGGGASAFYVADRLTKQGIQVLMINQDIAIGGGTRYFIRYDKNKMKLGLLKIFLNTLKNPHFLGYYGDIRIGANTPITLENFSQLGVNAIVLAVGSRGKKPLSLKGIDLKGVYNAYDLAQYYNSSTDYESFHLHIGTHVVILGIGNVTADMIAWLSDQKHEMVKDILVCARRGPLEFKMKPKEMKEVLPHLEKTALLQELNRTLDLFYSDPSLPYFKDEVWDEEEQSEKKNLFKLTKNKEEDIKTLLRSMHINPDIFLSQPEEHQAKVKVRFHFLAQPEELIGDDETGLKELVLSENKLVFDEKTKEVKAKKMFSDPFPIRANTFIYSIGSTIDPELGLQSKAQVLEPSSHSLYHLRDYPNIFMFGWARQPSKGLVGEAKADVDLGIQDLIKHIIEEGKEGVHAKEELENLLQSKNMKWITKKEVAELHEYELEKQVMINSRKQILSFLKKHSLQKNP